MHKYLESYKFPRDLRGHITSIGPVPGNLGPVFRDRADFASGPLDSQTIDALKKSQFLIVIASPASALSTYVNNEISLFKSFGGEDRILALIVAGKPPECFAPALRFHVAPDGTVTQQPVDLIAADTTKDGKNEAFTKIVAALVGLPYDTVWQRAVKASRVRNIQYAAAAAVGVFGVLASFGAFELWQDIMLRRQNARTALISNVINSIKTLDERLRLAKNSVDGSVKVEMEGVIEKYQSPVYDSIGSGFRRAIDDEILDSNYGLSHVSELVDAGVDMKAVDYFYDSLERVRHESGVLIDDMSSKGIKSVDNCVAPWKSLVVADFESLRIKSTIAYLRGMDLIDGILKFKPDNLGTQSADIKKVALELSKLAALRPINFVYADERLTLLSSLSQELGVVVKSKSTTLDNYKQAVTCEVHTIGTDMDVNPTDTWDVASAKARTLRHFGKIAESVTAFARYGAMFKATDPTAQQYAETAKAFTESIGNFGVDGGIYVFEVRPGGPEADAGLQVGDIIVTISGEKVPDMNALTNAYQKVKMGESMPITILRLNKASGVFDKVESELKRAALLRGVMPI